MKIAATCGICGARTEVTPLRLRHVTGLLLLAHSRVESALMCRRCAQRRFLLVTLHNLLLGWWSGPSFFLTPIALIQNTREMHRASQDFSLPLDQARVPAVADWDDNAIRRLPWAHLLGIRRGAQNLGHRQLTFPIAIGALTAFAMIIALIGCVTLSISNGANTPQEASTLRTICWTGLILGFLILSACIYWHRARTSRADDAFDIMSATLPQACMFDLGRAHLAAFACEVAGRLRFAVIAQNCFDQPSQLKLSISNSAQTFPLESPIAPGESLLFITELPCRPGPDALARLTITGLAEGRGGHRVRFARPSTLQTAARATLTKVAMALGGHFSFQWGNRQPGTLAFMDIHGEIAVAVPRAAPPRAFSPNWNRLVLWSPQSPTPPSYAASIFVRAIEEPPPTGK